MSKSPFVERHFEQRIARNADQAEFQAILDGTATIDSGFYDDEVSGAVDDFDLSFDEAIGLDWHQREVTKESGVGSIQEEIERRVALLGSAYPFVLRENTLHYRATANRVYEFCLAVSLQTDVTTKPFAYMARAFEKISALIVQEFAGPTATSFHVGAPRLGRMPAKFDEAMEAVAKATGEWTWAPGKNYPAKHSSTGDEGLDFVVSLRLGDKREGQLFFIGQCACGDDWPNKLHDLNYAKISKWFNPPWLVQPVRVFTTPHILSAGNLIDTQPEAGLVFDRVRLVSLSATHTLESALAAWPLELDILSKLVIKRAVSPTPVYVPPYELAARADRP